MVRVSAGDLGDPESTGQRHWGPLIRHMWRLFWEHCGGSTGKAVAQFPVRDGTFLSPPKQWVCLASANPLQNDEASGRLVWRRGVIGLCRTQAWATTSSGRIRLLGTPPA